ncbi:unnamed protein product [Spirodela intermedia]|uniref:Uncharacterized protein n=1 Tax=Spirodela intermedia TaxID=51605 RepID=A0A7I8JFC4_SPIIN|nr:unnamed protein product [Spirodela intermedia]CAA6668243.1 unnamed protein product [Spirodela intermedia]
MALQKGESSSQDLVMSGGLKGAEPPAQIGLGISDALHLEILELSDAIEMENPIKQKDQQVMLKNGGIPRLRTAQIQSLHRDHENLSTDDEDLILNYFKKLSHVVIELRSLEEKITDAALSTKLLRSVLGRTSRKPPQMEIAAEAKDAKEEDVAEEEEEVPLKSKIVMMNHSPKTSQK